MEKQEQPHGGALLTGGVPGNKGGGRPKDAVRAVMQEGLEKANEKLIAMLEQADLTPEQTTRIADVFGKYSIGTKQEVETVVKDPEIIVHFRDKITKHCGEEIAEVILSEVEAKLVK